MTPSTAKRGTSLEGAPVIKQPDVEDKPASATSKQTIQIGRKGLKRIRGICVDKNITFQEFAIRGLNRELHACGEPSLEELEAGE